MQLTFSQFNKFLQQGCLVPISREINADLETPAAIFMKLEKMGASFLLESVTGGENVARYSAIGLKPFLTLKVEDEAIIINHYGQKVKMALAGRDPLVRIKEVLERYKVAPVENNTPGLFSGLVGYLGYDVMRYFEKVPCTKPKGLNLPDAFFYFTDTLLIFDHVKRTLTITVLVDSNKKMSLNKEARELYKKTQKSIEEIKQALMKPLSADAWQKLNNQKAVDKKEQKSNFTKKQFKEAVDRAKKYIKAGDIFQVVLSQRLHGKTKAHPFQVYRSLRMLNPSPYMFYFDFDDFQLIGSSPEALVKLMDGQASVRPIAGTRPRGKTPEQDRQMKNELLKDEKELAEHIMLVDLARNDLGRVCEYGSVHATDLKIVERYSHVMHLVSNVEGELSKKHDQFDLFRACFPAGTVSGAPKVRAMEIINELEPSQRGPYAGAVGYFSLSGNMDMCITIRTIIMQGDNYYLQGGAGIVADSDPDKEYEETLNKIKALEKAVEK